MVTGMGGRIRKPATALGLGAMASPSIGRWAPFAAKASNPPGNVAVGTLVLSNNLQGRQATAAFNSQIGQ